MMSLALLFFIEAAFFYTVAERLRAGWPRALGACLFGALCVSVVVFLRVTFPEQYGALL